MYQFPAFSDVKLIFKKDLREINNNNNNKLYFTYNNKYITNRKTFVFRQGERTRTGEK